MRTVLKICGLRTPEAVDAAVSAGVDMVGGVFFAKSPRFLTPEAAHGLAPRIPGSIRKVALLVDAGDDWIERVVTAFGPDMLQLHGRETPERVAQLRQRFGLPVMKAIGVATVADIAPIAVWRDAADHLLIDAKPPKDAAYPGGHGSPFDWSILDGLDPIHCYMLSGGLDADNVAGAIGRLAPWGVDVSSGVESAPGIKDAAKIGAFVAAARAAATGTR